MTNRRDVQRRLLDEFILDAIKDQKPEDQLYIAALLDAKRYDVISEFDLDEDGQPDPHALWYRINLHQADGSRVGLVRVHYTRLAITDEEAEIELLATLAQHGIGIPDDLSELDES